MSDQKKGAIPKIEVLIVGAFFLIFTFWAAKKCSSTKSTYAEKAAREQLFKAQEDSIKQVLREKQRKDSLANAPISIQEATGQSRKVNSRLYVVIDGLKMRRTPDLDAEVIDEFDLFEEVFFLDEVTNFTQEINLGKEVANEPWVRIQSRQGRSGWVYGAGVNYYKKKHPGAE